LPPVLADPAQQPFHDTKRVTLHRRRGVGRKEAVKEQNRVDRWPMGNCLGQVSKTDQHQQDERHRGEQRVEGQSAGEERDVVFVSRLKSAGEETGG